MQVSQLASMTITRARVFTTRIYSRITSQLVAIPFVARNRKWLLLAGGLWLLLAAGCFGVYLAMAQSARDGFYREGVDTVEDLARKVSPFVLEKDVLSLNVALRDLRDRKRVIWAAITDHQGLVLSHTDAVQFNRPLQALAQERPLATIEGVRLNTGRTPQGKQAIGFTRTITFADVVVGRVVLAMDAAELKQSLAARQLFLTLLAGLSLVGGAGLLWWIDRRRLHRTREIQKAMENSDRIGPYLLRMRVATGGMAELFLADYEREDGFRRKVAIKRIRPHLVENPEFIRMFTREARLAALLQHPNIVQIFDYGKIGEVYFIAMEYIDGLNLGEILAAMKIGLPLEQALFIMTEVVKGLAYSHAHCDEQSGEPLNIVHRDISPQNLLVSCAGEVKISDFGISKARSEPNLTQAGVIRGKLAYMSPEQALGQPLDQRADLYALGLVFHETLTGLRVYRFTNEIEALRAIPKREIEPLTAILKQIPPQLNEIVMKCLAKDRAARYQSADELYTDLMAFRRAQKIVYDTSDLAAFMKRHFRSEGESGGDRSHD
jgi:hypothetical protein